MNTEENESDSSGNTLCLSVHHDKELRLTIELMLLGQSYPVFIPLVRCK